MNKRKNVYAPSDVVDTTWAKRLLDQVGRFDNFGKTYSEGQFRLCVDLEKSSEKVS